MLCTYDVAYHAALAMCFLTRKANYIISPSQTIIVQSFTTNNVHNGDPIASSYTTQAKCRQLSYLHLFILKWYSFDCTVLHYIYTIKKLCQSVHFIILWYPMILAILAITLNNCTGTACVEINKKLACTLPKSKNRVAAKCTSVASALVATRFCTSVMLYKRWVFISSTRSRAVMSVTPLCRWTCALVQVIERRALAYTSCIKGVHSFHLGACVCFNYLCSWNASSCLLSIKHEKVFLARICMYYTAP